MSESKVDGKAQSKNVIASEAWRSALGGWITAVVAEDRLPRRLRAPRNDEGKKGCLAFGWQLLLTLVMTIHFVIAGPPQRPRQ
jgi:hypothetical protein